MLLYLYKKYTHIEIVNDVLLEALSSINNYFCWHKCTIRGDDKINNGATILCLCTIFTKIKIPN